MLSAVSPTAFFIDIDMNIVTSTSTYCNSLTEYFDFNRIPYTASDFWDTSVDESGRYKIPNEIAHSESVLLVVDFKSFFELCSWDISFRDIKQFCRNKNKIWIWNDMDSLVSAITHKEFLTRIDNELPVNSVTLFLDGDIEAGHQLVGLQNIHCKKIPYSAFLTASRLWHADCNKNKCSKDFMITTIKKPLRPHRQILIDKINQHPEIAKRGYIIYHTVDEPRVGLQSHQSSWSDGYPSMDLYNDSWLEIVPETLYKDGLFITEKTVKPILTKTPFLTVSNYKFLDYLKQFGFKTFSSIISEEYDLQPRIEDRVKLLVAQLQDIVSNGADKFYNECKPILEHNQNRLFEITGRRQYDMDMFIAENLISAESMQ